MNPYLKSPYQKNPKDAFENLTPRISENPREFPNMKDSPQVSLSFRNEMCIDCGQRGDRRLMTNTCHLMEFKSTCLPGKRKVCSQCKECSYR